MTGARFAAVAWSVSCIVVATPAMQTPPRTALDLLAKARTALGGTAALAAIKTLRLTVHDKDRLGTRYPGANTTVAYAESRTTMPILLPDHFLVSTEHLTPFQAKARPWGFAGNVDIGARHASNPFREYFGYLMLALLLKNDTAFPFTVKGVSGNTVQLVDPNRVDVFVDFDPATSLPQRLRYDRLGRTGEGEFSGERFPTRVDIGSYAESGALRLPRTLTTFQGDVRVRERRIEAIELNPKLGPADFK